MTDYFVFPLSEADSVIFVTASSPEEAAEIGLAKLSARVVCVLEFDDSDSLVYERAVRELDEGEWRAELEK